MGGAGGRTCGREVAREGVPHVGRHPRQRRSAAPRRLLRQAGEHRAQRCGRHSRGLAALRRADTLRGTHEAAMREGGARRGSRLRCKACLTLYEGL